MDRNNQLEELFNDSQAVKKLWKQYFQKILGTSELSAAQIGIIFYVSEHQPVSGKAIASMFQVSPSAITQLIDGLERQGLIVRQHDAHDRRIIQISLSDKGNKKIDELQEKRKQFLLEITESLNTTELEIMVQAQKKMIMQLEQKLAG